jgi:prophage antirepressor-like protein
MASKKKNKKPVLVDLFGDPIKPPQQPSRTIMTLDFEGHRVRTINRNAATWWVGKDVCRVLGIAKDKQAICGNPSQGDDGLDADERGTYSIDTPGGPQKMLCVNESGLYSLIFKSRKPEAKRFRKWVTSEVLPSIRQHGCYPPPLTRVSRWKKRLNCDEKTAVSREKNCEVNISMHGRLASEGASPREFQDIHNATYRGQFDGQDCQAIKRVLGTKRTPLDRMSSEVLAANFYAKVLAERKIKDERVPLEKQAEVFEETARAVALGGLAHLGPDFRYGIDAENPRGPILDVIQLSLPSPN